MQANPKAIYMYIMETMRRDTSVTWSDECSRIMDAATDEISGVSQ
jgi:hypothetical protein